MTPTSTSGAVRSAISRLLGGSRTFSNGLRHAIQPSVVPVIPGQWGAVPGNKPSGPNQPVENRFYDEVDAAVLKTPLHQVARLTQTLTRRTGAVMQELLRLDVAQEFDFTQPNGLADTVVSLRGGYAPFLGGSPSARHPAACPGAVGGLAGVQTPRFGLNARLDQIYLPAQFYDRDVDPAQGTAGARNSPPRRSARRTSPASVGREPPSGHRRAVGAPSSPISRWASDRPRSPSTHG